MAHGANAPSFTMLPPFLMEKTNQIQVKKSAPPNSVEEVGECMLEMDRVYKTTFARWIQDEDNIAYFCRVKGPLINQFLKTDPDRAINALAWMSKEWSTASTSELILKLFYHIGISSQTFVDHVYNMTKAWDNERVTSVFGVILVGESASTVAQFINLWMITSEWPRDMLALLVTSLARSLRWNVGYSRDFLIEFAQSWSSEEKSQMTLCQVVSEQLDLSGPSKMLVDPMLDPGTRGVLRLQTLLNPTDETEVLEKFLLLFEMILQEKRLFTILSS